MNKTNWKKRKENSRKQKDFLHKIEKAQKREQEQEEEREKEREQAQKREREWAKKIEEERGKERELIIREEGKKWQEKIKEITAPLVAKIAEQKEEINSEKR